MMLDRQFRTPALRRRAGLDRGRRPKASSGRTSVAVRLGRRIYDNLRKATGFIFAVHVPIAGLALMPLALGLPILFGPIHIAFIEMVIGPVCSLVFEAESEEEDVMRRPPRPPSESMAPASLIAWSSFRASSPFPSSPASCSLG